MEKIICVLIGYLCGSFLTAVIVTRAFTGKDVSTLGYDGNPGMANVMKNVGFKAGILVLIGDIAKCVIASIITWCLFGKSLGQLVFLYTNLGTSLGHCYPFWRKFHGGKAVVTIEAAIILYSPLYGILASLAGFAVVLITKYLSIAGVVIPLIFTCIAFPLFGKEAGILSLVLTILSFIRHRKSIYKDLTGTGFKTDLVAKVTKKEEK